MYSNVLEVLLRLRQLCSHWKLCEARVKNMIAKVQDEPVVPLTEDNILGLQALLQFNIDALEECCICLDDLHDPVITACKHIFCTACIEPVIELQHKCPMCRSELGDKRCLVAPAPELATETQDFDVETQSSKTEALMNILASALRDPESKVVIFSQWTSFLNIIQIQIREAGYKFCRIDGTMSPALRDESLHQLDTNPSCRILLASLAVCSVGLNLISANKVILADSWWAPAIEEQAVDRVHRLGQTRPCFVWRLVMDESIEHHVLNIQAEKRALVGKAFGENAVRGGGRTSRMADILRLLT